MGVTGVRFVFNWDGRVGFKFGQIDPNGTNLELSAGAHREENVLKVIFKKIRDLFPIWGPTWTSFMLNEEMR